jgi:dTDP-4-dehydrorhamnose 3,5-epimerase
MEINEISNSGLFVIIPHTHRDKRGYFFESFRCDMMKKYNLPTSFIQENQSKSDRGTLRGLHYQLKYPQGKLVQVPFGKVYDVAVDIRMGSPTFGKYYGTILSDENYTVMFIPEGFAHGYSVLSDTAVFQYKCTNIYHREDEYGLRWDDSQIDIDWKISNPTLSKKDLNLPLLKNIQDEHLPVYEA